MTDNRDCDDSKEPTDRTEPTLKALTADPIEPIDRTDPTDPMESTDPSEPIDRNESLDHSDQRLRSTPRRARITRS
jgi:hypothetical protein